MWHTHPTSVRIRGTWNGGGYKKRHWSFLFVFKLFILFLWIYIVYEPCHWACRDILWCLRSETWMHFLNISLRMSKALAVVFILNYAASNYPFISGFYVHFYRHVQTFMTILSLYKFQSLNVAKINQFLLPTLLVTSLHTNKNCSLWFLIFAI